MDRLGSKTICGKASGMPFRNATRPNLSNQCPDGFSPCSAKTSTQNTICYETRFGKEGTCGITDIQFVDKTRAADYKARGYSVVDYDATTQIVFSKDTDSLPIT